MNAKEIAEKLVDGFVRRIDLPAMAQRMMEREMTDALIAYGDARLEQAAYRITLEEIEMPVSRQDTIENGILERASEIIRALKETK